MGDGPRGRRVEVEDKNKCIEIIEEAHKNGCDLKVACSDCGIGYNTYKRWKESTTDQRKGPNTPPKNKLSPEERAKIIEISTLKIFQDLSPWVIVACLADQNTYIASESTFYRVLRENKLINHRGKAKERKNKRPSPLVATNSNQIWSWDITYLKSDVNGIYYYLYLFMDIFSRKIVGYDVYIAESMENSSDLLNRIAKMEKINPNQITLHSDNGKPMKGSSIISTMQKLGVIPSFSRPSVSNDNPYSESLFKTLKYHYSYPDYFTSVEEAKIWANNFVNWYNTQHLHSGLKFVTPSSRHNNEDIEILENRKKVYLSAKSLMPLRWGTRKIRNWNREEEVFLNYLNKKNYLKEKDNQVNNDDPAKSSK